VHKVVLPAIERAGPVEAWIIDDTGFPKQGRHSVGVARQYCGHVGKQDNCQSGGVSVARQPPWQPAGGVAALSAAGMGGRSCARRKAHVPADITFKTKVEIALDQLRWACAAGLPRGVVLLDAGYGNNSDLRAEITALDLTYVAGILSTITVWPPGTAPLGRTDAPTPRSQASADRGQGACTGGCYPKVIDPAVPPLRPERHIPNSITTMRRRLIAAVVRTLPRCPCCSALMTRHPRRKNF
jgi:SRSO17 transposase